ncbi:MAG: hypothetical protein ACOVOG_14540, partial [Rubrivivax sp.]
MADFLSQPGHDGIQVELATRSGIQVAQGIRDGVAPLGICWHSPHGADLRGLTHAPYRSDRLGLVPHPVQWSGVCTLLSGRLAEMRTGEGKTLVAALAACVMAGSGAAVHVVSTNDYLAERDSTEMS